MNYQKITFKAGNNVEDAVKKLMDYKAKGILACGEFNGIILYSNTITMDIAYLQVFGKTKLEFDQSQQDWLDEYEKIKREYQDKIPDLACLWMKKGREILPRDKWECWDKIVPIRLNDLYHGMELGCCLDIVKILNDGGTLDEAEKEIVNQDHSYTSFGLVCKMVKEFCDRGQEFHTYVTKGVGR